MAVPAAKLRTTSLPDTFRARLRARMAELELTEEDLSARLTQLAPTMLGTDHKMKTGRAKIGHARRGEVLPKLNELAVWARALETTEEYLLGFRWNPTEGFDSEPIEGKVSPAKALPPATVTSLSEARARLRQQG